MAFIPGLVAGLIVVLSCYALVNSAQSIPKLQTYEAKAQKAAEWSSTAEARLWDTRKTVAAGFAMTTVSLLSGVAFLFFVPDGFSYQRVAWAASLCVGERLSSQYMYDFWANKHKIPLMDEYNDAISETENVVKFSDALSIAWGFVSAFKLIGL